MRFTLPMPPSINQTYGVNRDQEFPFYKKQAVKQWEHDAGWEIKTQKKGKKTFTGRVSIGIKWFVKTDRDIDAGLKVLLDLFERTQVVLNDRQFRRVNYIDIQMDKKNPRVEVNINEMV